MLVHGYRCNSGLWWWMIARLRAAGFAADAIDLEPALSSIDRFAEQLHRHIEACLQDAGSAKLRLVTHSMGGLVARAYLQRYGTARVDKLITLACPHHGTRIARLGCGQNARQMEPGSAWLAALGEPAPVPAVTIWTAQDNFVGPQTSSRLSGAQDIVVAGIGHLAFMFSRRVLDIVLEDLS
jgi:triacylglycerol lipase